MCSELYSKRVFSYAYTEKICQSPPPPPLPPLPSLKKTMMEFLFAEVETYDNRFTWNYLRSSFDGFSRITIIWNSCKIIDKFCSSPLVIFQNMAYIFMQVIRNGKTFECSVFN